MGAGSSKEKYLRIATEEAYAPTEMLRLYRKLIDEKGTDDPGFLSQWAYFLGDGQINQALPKRFADIGEGRIRDMPVERITDVMTQLLYGTIFINYFTGQHKSPNAQAEDIVDIVFHGILSDKERQTSRAKSRG